MNTQKQIFLIVALFFIFVGGCAAYTAIDLPYRAPEQDDWTKSESVERGALLFANNCRTCHGIKGQGGVGPTLNKPEFKDEDPLVLKANQALIRTTLTCGRAGTLMPAWLNTNGGSLNRIQLEHLIDLITSPVKEGEVDDEGNPTSKGWNEAVEFAHNLNRETSALIGGDTLDTIARAHGIGDQQLADLNHLPVAGIIKQGTELKIPGFKGDPNGYTYVVYNDNETIGKIVDSQHVGAVMIADLNNIPYKFTHKKGKATLQLLDDKGASITGLFPGTTIALPEGATYTVAAGDKIDDIASRHGVSASDIRSLNSEALSGADSSKPLDHERKLKLPSGAAIVAREGDTLALLATQHGIKADELAQANKLAADAVIQAGQKLALPSSDTRYTVQTGDTLQTVAALHAVDVQALASANNLKADDPISPLVVLKLPRVEKYSVKGDSLESVAKSLSNVTAESLGKANGVAANTVLRVGQSLKLPADSWGSAPPDTKNPGTACVQHAVPNSVFAVLPGVGSATPAASVTPPASTSRDVKVEAHANDWTVTGDGAAQPPNKGLVLVAKGAAVPFSAVSGLHTITVNGKKDGDDLRQGTNRSITFNDAGQFKITCDYHPDMLANIFVQ